MLFWSGIHGIVVARKMPNPNIQQGAQKIYQHFQGVSLSDLYDSL
jgi:hypothetical protein